MSDPYHDDYSSVSKSMLDMFATSSMDYYLTYVARELPRPHKQNDAMSIGSICHAMLLERKPLDSIAAIYPDECYRSDGNLNCARAAEFRQNHAGYYCIRAGQAEQILSIVEAVEESFVAGLIRDAVSLEHRYDAEVYGVKCKCKPDILYDIDVGFVIYDLKFAEDVSPFRFQQTALRFRYWLQDAHYSEIVERAIDCDEIDFRFVAIETKYPYRVQQYWYSEQSQLDGSEEHARLLRSLRICQTSGHWADHWCGELSLRPWEIGQQEELTGFEDAES